MAEKVKKSNDTKFKALPVVADINVTPMVDVMLVLLIIFMVITPMLSKGVSVNLPKTDNPIPMKAADKSDAIVIAITQTGQAFLNVDKVSADQLAPKVKDLLSGRTDKTVFLKSDMRAKYQAVLDVVQNLQAAGVDQLGLLTEQNQDRRRGAGAANTPAVQK
ncbi:MAG TPA: biopolymer transporter ExbD [Bryobacteraceae bacterium]|nr:biopolymer transporter ExbD [Bryobacteraceae bacterium]